MNTLGTLIFLISILGFPGPKVHGPTPIPIILTCIPIGAPIPQESVRGTFVRIEVGSRPFYAGAQEKKQQEILVVKVQASELRIWMDPHYFVKTAKQASLDDISEGTKLGVIGIPHGQGPEAAVSILVLPKGNNDEGTRRWDLRPRSRFTFGTVVKKTAARRGWDLTLSYAEDPESSSERREKDILVGADVSIATVTASNSSVLTARTPSKCGSVGMSLTLLKFRPARWACPPSGT